MSTTVSPRTGRARKYSGGVSTLSLPSRVAFTASMLVVGAVLVGVMLSTTHRPDTRISGFVLFLLGLWSIAALLVLPYVWRPSAEWQRDRYHGRQLERELRAAFDPRIPRHLSTQRTLPPCPVCGQDGVVLVPARMQCTACQRPWLARAS